jgi:hypothetical protein
MNSWSDWRLWLRAWGDCIGRYGRARQFLVAGSLLLAVATTVLAAQGAISWTLTLALAQAAGVLLAADALGRIVAGVVCDYLFERRVSRLCAPLRLHALATGDLEAAEAQTRALLAEATVGESRVRPTGAEHRHRGARR